MSTAQLDEAVAQLDALRVQLAEAQQSTKHASTERDAATERAAALHKELQQMQESHVALSAKVVQLESQLIAAEASPLACSKRVIMPWGERSELW